MIKKIQTDIFQYGKEGDNTLEYIGINVNERECREYKCYRFIKKHNQNDFPTLSVFEECQGLKKLDMQKADNNAWRISYKVIKEQGGLKDKLDMILMRVGSRVDANELLEINEFLKKILEVNEELLCVIGVKINKFHCIESVKFYYDLELLHKEKNTLGSKEKDKYKTLFERLEKQFFIKYEEMIKMYCVVRVAHEFNYNPMMLGIDVSKNFKTIKYYYKKSNYDDNDNGYELIVRILEILDMQSNDELELIFHELSALSYFLKGFALSYNVINKKVSVLNLYWAEK